LDGIFSELQKVEGLLIKLSEGFFDIIFLGMGDGFLQQLANGLFMGFLLILDFASFLIYC